MKITKNEWNYLTNDVDDLEDRVCVLQRQMESVLARLTACGGALTNVDPRVRDAKHDAV